MESAPQSTITHNAVIEFASDPGLTPRHRRGSGGRIKRRPALPKRAALNRRDHAKIVSPAQRREGHKRSISAGICAWRLPAFRRNPRNGCKTGALSAISLPCASRNLGADDPAITVPIELTATPASPALPARTPRSDSPGSRTESRNRRRRKRWPRCRRCRARAMSQPAADKGMLGASITADTPDACAQLGEIAGKTVGHIHRRMA